MNAEIIPLADGRIAIGSPYNAEFVAALKSEIPANSRQWDGSKKVWVIEEAEANAATSVTARFYTLYDRRTLSAGAVEDAKIEAEISEIVANQKAVLAATDWIEAKITELNAIISRYSFRSHSAVKSAYAQDRALLRHALTNAALPVEKLAEVQVRGLAAAVRYIENGGKSYR